jgi:hypothetical protein
MDCDWLFLNKDGTKIEATLKEATEPSPGDGKWNNSVPYVVRYVLTGRVTNPNPFVIATEQ